MATTEVCNGTVYWDREEELVHLEIWPVIRPDDIIKIGWSRESAERIAKTLLKVVALVDEESNSRWEELWQ